MKITREQVSQLSDVELNLGMTWFYSGSDKGLNGRYIDGELYYNMGTGRIYEYLTDYSLTMPLAVEYEVQLLTGQGESCWHIAKKQYYDYDGPISSISIGANSPLRAICEVLLMIAMEREE